MSGRCLNNSDFVKTGAETTAFSNLTITAILLCVGAIVIFVLVFLCLMWRDRRRDAVDSIDRSQYNYSKVPVRYQLNGKDSVIAANGKLPLSLEEEEHFLSDEDEDEMVYDSDMMIKR